MKEVLRYSLWCLFAALAMNALFTNAQGLVPHTPFPDLSWLQVRVKGEDSKPTNTVIYTSAEPVVTEYAPRHWKIEFAP